MHAASGKHADSVKREKKCDRLHKSVFTAGIVRENNHVTAAKRGKTCKCYEMRETMRLLPRKAK